MLVAREKNTLASGNVHEQVNAAENCLWLVSGSYMSPSLGVPIWGWTNTALLLALAATMGPVPLAWTYATGNYSWTVAVSSDGRYVIAGSDDMHAYFFSADASEGRPVWTLSAHGYVRHVAISSNGTRAAASDNAGNIYFFRYESSGTPVWSYRATSAVDALDLSSDGRYLVAGDRDGAIYLFDTNAAGSLVWYGLLPGGVLDLALSESRALAVSSIQGGVYFYDVASAQSGHIWSFQESTSFPRVAMLDDASYVIAGGSDGYVYMINASGQATDKQRLGGAISALSISDNTHGLIAGSTSGRVLHCLIKDRLQTLGSLETQQPVTSATLSENAKRISFANLDGTVSVFNQSLTSPLWTFNAGAIVHSLSISSDGTILAASSDTGSIYLFHEQPVAQTEKFSYATLLVPMTIMILVLGYFLLRRRGRSGARRIVTEKTYGPA